MAKRLEISGIRWILGPTLDPRECESRIRRALAAVASGQAKDLKSGRRKRLYPLDLAGDGSPDHLLKVNHYGRRRESGALRWRRSKSRMELARAEGARGRGIDAPLPLAAGERWEGLRLISCFLLIERIPDSVDLRELWFQRVLPGPERRRLARDLGAFIRSMHEAGIDQEDLAPNNILVSRRPEGFVFHAIDFERAHLRRRVATHRRDHALAKFDRVIFDATRSERLAFLQGYCDSGRLFWRERWRAIAARSGGLLAQELAHLRRNVGAKGRRFEALELGKWTGLVARGAKEDLGPALESSSGNTPLWTKDCWGIPYPDCGEQDALDLLARAQALYVRRWGPRPIGIFWQKDQVRLLARPPRGWRALGVPEGGDRGPVTLLLDRLWHGDLPLPSRATEIVLCESPRGQQRALLLAPRSAAPDRKGSGVANLKSARRLADELLGRDS